MNSDARTQSLLEQHWKASERGDNDTEHAIYAEDAILDYPCSLNASTAGRSPAAQRGGHPAERHFTVPRRR